MNKFDKWWYEFGGGYATPGGDEEDAARYAWESALDAAVEALKEESNHVDISYSYGEGKCDGLGIDAVETINKLRGES